MTLKYLYRFGSHIRQLHMDCNQHMIDFANDEKEAGKQALLFIYSLIDLFSPSSERIDWG